MGCDIYIPEDQAGALLAFLHHNIQEEIRKYSCSVDNVDYLANLLCAYRDLKCALGEQEDG